MTREPGGIAAVAAQMQPAGKAVADWIVEVVIERLDIKQGLYRRLDEVRKPGTPISSNTSTIPLAKLVEGLPQRQLRLMWGKIRPQTGQQKHAGGDKARAINRAYLPYMADHGHARRQRRPRQASPPRQAFAQRMAGGGPHECCGGGLVVGEGCCHAPGLAPGFAAAHA